MSHLKHKGCCGNSNQGEMTSNTRQHTQPRPQLQLTHSYQNQPTPWTKTLWTLKNCNFSLSKPQVATCALGSDQGGGERQETLKRGISISDLLGFSAKLTLLLPSFLLRTFNAFHGFAGGTVPWAIANEDAFPYRQCAVIPHQQKVKHFICHPVKEKKHRIKKHLVNYKEAL